MVRAETKTNHTIPLTANGHARIAVQIKFLKDFLHKNFPQTRYTVLHGNVMCIHECVCRWEWSWYVRLINVNVFGV